MLLRPPTVGAWLVGARFERLRQTWSIAVLCQAKQVVT